MTAKQVVMEILQDYVGEAHPIKARALRSELRKAGHAMSIPDLRGLIHDMRNAEYMIASSQGGYFIPETLAEAKAYVERVFRKPAKDQLLTARRQRWAAINRFGGQLRFA